MIEYCWKREQGFHIYILLIFAVSCWIYILRNNSHFLAFFRTGIVHGVESMGDKDLLAMYIKLHGCRWLGDASSLDSRSHATDIIFRNIPVQHLKYDHFSESTKIYLSLVFSFEVSWSHWYFE